MDDNVIQISFNQGKMTINEFQDCLIDEIKRFASQHSNEILDEEGWINLYCEFLESNPKQ